MKIKSNAELQIMEGACKLAAEALAYTGSLVKAGITTNELDRLANEFIKSKGAISACIGYNGYPKAICTSVNDVACHGVPDDKELKDGDIINIDVTVIKDGFHGDTSSMFFVGNVSEEARKLCDVAYQAMMKGIEAITPNGNVGDIGFASEKYITRNGFYVVKEIGGHGIGRGFHEEPWVPPFGKKGKGAKLLVGGAITVEPIVNFTPAPLIEKGIPGSSVTVFRTSDKKWSAQYEHTVAITQKGPKIMTLL